jgi:lipoprotein-anchoring transpeptidase ErfK/SrfK
MVKTKGFWIKTAAVAAGTCLLSCFAAPVLAQVSAEISPEIVPETPSEALTAAEIAAAIKVGIAEMRLVLSIEARQVSLYRGEKLISSYPVAVGAAETPTPIGQFTVSQMVIEPIWQSPWTGEIHEPGQDSALGLRWIGFSTTEQGAFGFHGTPTVESIGQAASNGCVRMYNEDIVALFEQVTLGTVVMVTP